jgi:hypothetical protein
MAWQDNKGNSGTDDNVFLSKIPEEEKIKVMLEKDRLVAEAPYHPGYEDASFTNAGRKFDGGKPQYGLLPPLALKATVEILTFGAEKYEPDNWKYVPDSKRRYFDSVQRHLWAWKEGEQTDPESGKNHLAHAICGLMFLFEHDVEYSLDK